MFNLILFLYEINVANETQWSHYVCFDSFWNSVKALAAILGTKCMPRHLIDVGKADAARLEQQEILSKGFQLKKLWCTEVYYTNASILLVKIMLFSELSCQEVLS